MAHFILYYYTVPSHPRNVTVHEITPSSINISWLEPEKPNGPNIMYRIYYTFLNQTLLAMPKNDPMNGMKTETGVHHYTLRKLSKSLTQIYFSLREDSNGIFLFDFSPLFSLAEPFTEYKIVVVAITPRYDGNASTPITIKTDVAAPSPPIVSSLACQKDGTIYVKWKRPTIYFNTIDFYIISFKASHWDYFRQFQINSSAEHIEIEVGQAREFFLCSSK